MIRSVLCGILLQILFCEGVFGQGIVSGSSLAKDRGVYEVRIEADSLSGNLCFDHTLIVTFSRPDGSEVSVDGFHDGAGVWKARAYCDQLGIWKWRSQSESTQLDAANGTFKVVESNLPGKLRKHPDDPFQFARDDGSWFLHLGDTGYRYVVVSEPEWRAYIDQASEAGFTKIRTWFAQSRSTVDALYTEDRSQLALDYWQEIDRRLLYALEKHPHIDFQLIPYAEDTQEIRRYGKGDRMSRLIGRTAQARWSALPNVHWAISNDQEIVAQGPLRGREVLHSTIDQIGRDFAKRDPWGTLLTNHQCRFSGYAFVESPWSDIITVEDLDQVAGKIILRYRESGMDPIVNDEDRYELYRNAGNRRYFFRRLMWASLLSGGHATYGGLKTYEAHDGGPTRGVQGYFDANRDGVLFQGAHDFRHIHRFFQETGVTLVGLRPDDTLVGADPLRFKCSRDEKTIIVYLANPSGEDPVTDNPGVTKPTVAIHLPRSTWNVQWFNPRTGGLFNGKPLSGASRHRLTPPHDGRSTAGDWVLLLRQG